MRYPSVFRSDSVIVITLIAAVVFVFFSIGKTQADTPSVAEANVVPVAQAKFTDPGHLVFDESFHDFGMVTEGAIVKHTFKFRNAGAGMLKIDKIESSCGCTTINNVLKEYAPGEQGKIDAVVDTVGKKGVVVKTLSLTVLNNKAEKLELSLAMNLVPPPHPMKTSVSNLNADPKCKTCHLENGQGQTGIFLYHRVCAQCHGKKGIGASAIALNDANWQKTVTDRHLKQRIEDGFLEAGMPSFVTGVTPPLQADQVESLVSYIREIVSKTQKDAK